MSTSSIILKQVKLTRPGGFGLDNLNMELPQGANLVITGPSGSGKTSLGMALAGKLFVTGQLEVNLSTDAKSAGGRKVQMVDQRYTIKNRSNTVDGYYQQRYNSLDNEDAYTVLEELMTIIDNPEIIKAHLSSFGIDYLLDKTLLTLSSGEHKRFQLVKMLLDPAPVVILDEPFVGLDIQARASLNLFLENLTRSGIQLITLTGARDHFPVVATHVLELMEGNASYFGELKDYQPGFHPAVQRYDLSSLDLEAAGADSDVNGGTAFDNAIIKMEHLHIAYADKVIFDDLNWQVLAGERWLLKGPNGAGKSTLLSLIYGDNPRAYANEIYLFGKKRGTGESIWDIKAKMGFVSPELHAFFDKNITVFQTVASGFFDTMGLYRKLSEKQTELIHNWLTVLGLTQIQQKRLSEISTGQQRLIMLLRAFVKNPPLLILDEPCQGLDQWQTEAFVKLVEDYCKKTGASLIYISHYASEIPAVVTSVLELLGDGKGGYHIFKVARMEKVKQPSEIIR
ncbi:molybdate transport system ATP-binding protein [Arachidicoccus rhizosphaerae]|uniref:Molybdate transport system ATP-binding protein n=1 Tax=Arachidicoccus rhizosphaerae TaxID=551991 RepID=A0A1H4BWY7_9BACT|nr:ATP-binding cassette domain-containing protein [Arachidicoccus rhizosphaerae]SEA52715.1 molybdate transport system ATP-binding protein [Arachidicoccus rhizosphaerae]